MITKELLQAYEATCYSILAPEIDIYLTNENSDLQQFLIKHKFTTWCFITAWNPYSKALSLEDNIARNKLLEKDLSAHHVFSAEGKDASGIWPPEISFFVGNITKEQAVLLGKKYEQNAIVYGEVQKNADLVILI